MLFALLAVVLMGAISLAGCGSSSPTAGGGGGTPAVVLPGYYVNAATGLDTNAGTQAAPFKTITKAMAVAVASNATALNINVAAGTYNAANGEVFPIVVASNAVATINLVGTGSPMLAGAGNYTISGGQLVGAYSTALAFASGTKGSVTGFAASESVFFNPTTIIVDGATVTISNNKFDFLANNNAYVIWAVNGAQATINNNIMSGWVTIDTADTTTKVIARGNTLTGGFTVCTADFTPSAAQLDFGTAASPGNNTLTNPGGGTAALNSWAAAGDLGVTAVGNTWTPNVQWADAAGHYPAGVLTGASAANGPNFNIMPTAGIQLYTAPGSVTAPHTAK